ncbi:MAG: nicotinate-nucleotide adenylyltransferase [Syntrophobacterales bacterium]|jgi:nicotinate-nucleotide adenylyltransferase|nr:nicotinate-nucleotide adenylyltransferase [Syntrophobacterales bacterium]
MAIGIFGGTFDPVHIGHMRAAEEIRESFGIEKVFFVPAYIPPHKRGRRVSDVDHRMEMLRIAVRNNPFLRLSELEIRRGGISYSIDTLETFEKRYGELYFIMGLDAFLEIDTWHRYEELFSHADFVIMLRPIDRDISDSAILPETVRRLVRKIDDTTLLHTTGKKIYLKRVTQLDISSTQIREALSRNESIRYLVPERVERFISERGLYRA